MTRVHIVPVGTMPKELYVQRSKPLLYTPQRYGTTKQSSRSPMASLCDYFNTYGVNSSPLRSGVTGGERRIVSTRNISKFTATA